MKSMPLRLFPYSLALCHQGYLLTSMRSCELGETLVLSRGSMSLCLVPRLALIYVVCRKRRVAKKTVIITHQRGDVSGSPGAIRPNPVSHISPPHPVPTFQHVTIALLRNDEWRTWIGKCQNGKVNSRTALKSYFYCNLFPFVYIFIYVFFFQILSL